MVIVKISVRAITPYHLRGSDGRAWSSKLSVMGNLENVNEHFAWSTSGIPGLSALLFRSNNYPAVDKGHG